MKRSVMDSALNIKPIFIGFEHLYYYEGPCRMGGGDAIQPGFDEIAQAQMCKGLDLWQIRKSTSAAESDIFLQESFSARRHDHIKQRRMEVPPQC
jgi:hypothetical protein